MKTTYGQDPKHYDQIAWFRDDLTLLSEGRAGVIDFVGAVFKDMSTRSMTYRVSDHLPLWVEFMTDRSVEALALTLGVGGWVNRCVNVIRRHSSAVGVRRAFRLRTSFLQTRP